MDAAGLRLDVCLASYSGVAAARHFDLELTLLLPLPRQPQRSHRAHGRSPRRGSSRWRAQWQNERDKLVAVELVAVEHVTVEHVAVEQLAIYAGRTRRRRWWQRRWWRRRWWPFGSRGGARSHWRVGFRSLFLAPMRGPTCKMRTHLTNASRRNPLQTGCLASP